MLLLLKTILNTAHEYSKTFFFSFSVFKKKKKKKYPQWVIFSKDKRSLNLNDTPGGVQPPESSPRSNSKDKNCPYTWLYP